MEQDQKVVVNIAQGVNLEKPIEIILREGKAARAVEELPTKEPVSISLSGVIDTPLRWLEKRIGQIDQKQANLVVDREAMTLKLTVNEADGYLKNTFTGRVAISEVFEKFGINRDNKVWEPARLGQFLRLNRGLFEDKEMHMVLVSKLKNFIAKAKAEIQKMKDPSGSTADVYKSHVESNLPKSFRVSIAIFKGGAKQVIEVEFDHHLTNGEVYLQLVSPGANELVETYRDSCIDAVLDEIKVIAPDIAILEV